MSNNLLVLCKSPADTLAVKKVKIVASAQSELSGIFQSQESSFFDKVDNEILFDGGWIPGDGDILYVDMTAAHKALLKACRASAVSLEDVGTDFAQHGVVALCMLVGSEESARLLIQNFSINQTLSRKFTLISEEGTFNKLDEAVFSIAGSLAAVLKNEKLFFKSYSNIRRIFDLQHAYAEATNKQLQSFAGHALISVADPDKFIKIADQPIRRLVHALIENDSLAGLSARSVSSKAKSFGFQVEVADGKIVLPEEKRAIKDLLHFLDEAYYTGVLTGKSWLSNSKRRVP
jgi:hypothetical protein